MGGKIKSQSAVESCRDEGCALCSGLSPPAARTRCGVPQNAAEQRPALGGAAGKAPGRGVRDTAAAAVTQ